MEPSYTLGNRNPENLFILKEVTFQASSVKIFSTFSYKKEKFSKLKYFLIIIIEHFFSFYIIFFYSQPVYFFHLLRDFCNVHDHIVAFFFFFFLRKILISCTSFFCSLSLCSLEYLADKILKNFYIYVKKIIKK